MASGAASTTYPMGNLGSLSGAAYLSPLRYKGAESSLRGHRRNRGWLEKSPIVGERWLRKAAADGDCFAMVKLGERLLEGDGLEVCAAEGLNWLRKAVASDYVPAMENLGKRLLDSDEEWRSPTEGEELLSKAARLGQATSAFDLGHRCLKADRVPLEIDKGFALLRDAAHRGDRLAMVVLGNAIEVRSRIASQEVEKWLICAGAPKPEILPKLGRYVYSRACLAITAGEHRRISTEAADIFALGFRRNPADTFCALNLAYLLRRGEVPEAPYPPFEELVNGLIEAKNEGALVNQALRLASGYRCDVNWQAADELFQSLTASLGVLEWYLARSREGDAEGHLVVGWLMRMSLTDEIDGVDLASRLSMASGGFPSIPHWMFQVKARSS